MKLRRDKSEKALAASPRVAANGLLDRRIFLQRGVAGGLALAGGMAGARAATVGDGAQSWQKQIGAPMSTSGSPSRFVEDRVQRGVLKPYGAIAPGTGVSMTPLHELQGTVTPNRLHFERHHNGVPDIDPDQHSLTLHGLVKKPLVFDMAALSRYPMTNRTCFIECSGNSFFNTFPEAKAFPAGMIHGLVSCSEWTGVPLSVLLDEAGVDRRAKWIIAEGADAATMARSIPLSKALDDVIVALYQNGEPVRPEQGYPMRLVNPGYEGNTSIKWLHRIKVSDRPAHTKDETSKYTDLLPDGSADQFTFAMGVKSVITASVRWYDHGRRRLLRNLRSCLVGCRPRATRGSLCRWRQDLGRCAPARPPAGQESDALLDGLALGRFTGAVAKSRNRRQGAGAEHSSTVEVGVRSRPCLSLQCDSVVGCQRPGRSQQCVSLIFRNRWCAPWF